MLATRPGEVAATPIGGCGTGSRTAAGAWRPGLAADAGEAHVDLGGVERPRASVSASSRPDDSGVRTSQEAPVAAGEESDGSVTLPSRTSCSK